MPENDLAAETGPKGRSLSRHLSPPRLLMLVILLIFISEWAVMLILRYLPPLRWELLAVIDAILLLGVLSPCYFLLYRPLQIHDSERRKAEREVAFLTRHVIRAVEKEKKRLAHDMHDDCGQLLTRLQFGIAALKCSLPESAPELVRQCEHLAGLTASLAEHMRNLTARLSPVLLENAGIEPALRWHLQEVGADYPELRLDLQVAGCTRRLDPEVEITLFRLCQEGLHNIVRHARAKRADIRLDCGDGKIQLLIEDDGAGFDPGVGHSGFGLLGMRERVSDLGGRLTIRSAPGRGTSITAALPIVKERE